MRRWQCALVNAALVAASTAITLLTIEVVLRFLPIAWAPPVEPPSAANPIQRYVPNRAFTWSTDWNLNNVVRGRSNAQGFLADYDYDATAKTPLVAVIGDSFIEALRVPFAESITGRMQAALGNRGRAYAFAQSGSPLSQYVAYAQHACAIYRPERMVVNVIGNDFDQSIYANRLRNGIYHLYPSGAGGFDFKLTPLPPPGLAERVLRRSALALYLMRNVGITSIIDGMGINMAQAKTQADRFVGQTSSDASPRRVKESYRVIDWFIEALPQAACLPPQHIAIVVDTPRPQIYDARDLARVQDSYFALMRKRLLSAATERGFKVVDTEPVFIASFAADKRPFEPATDGHWNSHGHAVVTAALLKTMADWMPLTAGDRR